ncbi:hypothetical protein P3S68_030693 [Capsicum galapagoense]
MAKHIFLLILLFLIQYYSVFISAASSNETDLQALLAFKNLVASHCHFLTNNWTENTSFCSWFGVTCSSKRQTVVPLSLPNMQLQGTISPSLANLSFLSVLNLRNISIHGGIPYGLGHLPPFLFQHQGIQVISLAYNKLGGEMWKGPWYVNNSLMGIISPSVGNATKLLNLCLDGNKINGNIPKEIGNLSQVVELSLYDNELTGFIPAALFNISSLFTIHLQFNSLSGPLLLDDETIVSNLKYLSIYFNQISGNIPSNICQLTELEVLSLSFNKITGKIPKNIGCLSKLEHFYIGDNQIKGTIPTSLGNISALQNLNCGRNGIVGKIPLELGKLSNLRVLSFVLNYNLIGEIPEAIFNMSSLEIISFSYNNLSGRIPTTVGLYLPNLERLYLEHVGKKINPTSEK